MSLCRLGGRITDNAISGSHLMFTLYHLRCAFYVATQEEVYLTRMLGDHETTTLGKFHKVPKEKRIQKCEEIKKQQNSTTKNRFLKTMAIRRVDVKRPHLLNTRVNFNKNSSWNLLKQRTVVIPFEIDVYDNKKTEFD